MENNLKVGMEAEFFGRNPATDKPNKKWTGIITEILDDTFVHVKIKRNVKTVNSGGGPNSTNENFLNAL